VPLISPSDFGIDSSLGFRHLSLKQRVTAALEKPSHNSWLHRFAVLTAAAVFPLLVLGGLVTSMRVGMADPVPLREPWYMLLLNWQQTLEERGSGYLIEHGHRQLGWIVGFLAIALTAWLVCAERRRWVRCVGVVALVGVAVQGGLGILRVDRNAAGIGLELAMVHGVCGPMVFALFAAIAAFTSRSWIEGQTFDVEDGARFRRVSRLTVFMMLLQLVAGVFLRQIGQDMGLVPLLVHVFFAMAVVAHVVMLWVRVGRWRTPPAVINRAVMILLAIMGLQVLLGMAAWVYGGGAGAVNQALAPIGVPLRITATSHSAVGALMLAASLLVALRATRHLNGQPAPANASAPSLTPAGGAA
jgi:cytochrome c oxidase assembly protein subunit 15